MGMITGPTIRRGNLNERGNLLVTALIKIAFACLAVLGLTTLAIAQSPTLGARDPSDPLERAPDAGYQSVTSGAQSFRPIDPLPWRGVNERVAPKPKPEPEKK